MNEVLKNNNTYGNRKQKVSTSRSE
jgi:hypothetical protein